MSIEHSEKVYAVEFMCYTNCLKDTVSDCIDPFSSNVDLSSITYIDVGKEQFLVRESELEYYRKFGGGYRNIRFIGNIVIKN